MIRLFARLRETARTEEKVVAIGEIGFGLSLGCTAPRSAAALVLYSRWIWQKSWILPIAVHKPRCGKRYL